MCPGGNGMRQSFIFLIFPRFLPQRMILELISLLRWKEVMGFMTLSEVTRVSSQSRLIIS
jgi:hypothetical protein